MTDKELFTMVLDALSNFDKGNHGMRWQVPLIKALRARLATCDRCGKVNPAELHTCTPPQREWVGLTYADLYFWGGELGLGELGKGVLRAVDAHLREKNHAD